MVLPPIPSLQTTSNLTARPPPTRKYRDMSIIVHDTASKFPEPSSFWRRIKQLIGTKHPDQLYLLDNDNTKVYIYTLEGKEALHRQLWSTVPTEDNPGNPATELRVQQHLTQHQISTRQRPHPSIHHRRVTHHRQIVKKHLPGPQRDKQGHSKASSP